MQSGRGAFSVECTAFNRSDYYHIDIVLWKRSPAIFYWTCPQNGHTPNSNQFLNTRYCLFVEWYFFLLVIVTSVVARIISLKRMTSSVPQLRIWRNALAQESCVSYRPRYKLMPYWCCQSLLIKRRNIFLLSSRNATYFLHGSSYFTWITMWTICSCKLNDSRKSTFCHTLLSVTFQRPV